jgi:membrane protein insertase Oxa1/YidC/SpoIIIJ
MTESPQSDPQADPPYAAAPPPAYAAAPPPAYGGVPVTGSVGKVRSTGICILLYIVTLGIYSWYYYYKTHEELKQHTGQGIGGVVALILAIFINIVNPYLLSAEVGNVRRLRGQEQRVSGATGLWFFPGMFILVGPIIWFVKTNGALNDYWVSQGATA